MNLEETKYSNDETCFMVCQIKSYATREVVDKGKIISILLKCSSEFKSPAVFRSI